MRRQIKLLVQRISQLPPERHYSRNRVQASGLVVED
jgi:hypothetical protein